MNLKLSDETQTSSATLIIKTTEERETWILTGNRRAKPLSMSLLCSECWPSKSFSLSIKAAYMHFSASLQWRRERERNQKSTAFFSVALNDELKNWRVLFEGLFYSRWNLGKPQPISISRILEIEDSLSMPDSESKARNGSSGGATAFASGNELSSGPPLSPTKHQTDLVKYGELIILGYNGQLPQGNKCILILGLCGLRSIQLQLRDIN